jgi:hypothetical protein
MSQTHAVALPGCKWQREISRVCPTRAMSFSVDLPIVIRSASSGSRQSRPADITSISGPRYPAYGHFGAACARRDTRGRLVWKP